MDNVNFEVLMVGCGMREASVRIPLIPNEVTPWFTAFRAYSLRLVSVVSW